MNIKKFYIFLVLGLAYFCACAMPEQNRAKGKPSLPKKFTEFKLDAQCKDDPLVSEIRRYMEARASILDLIKFYLKGLEKDAGPDSPYLKKLERLFACGLTKDEVEGHFYGITLVLKKGEYPRISLW